MLLTSSRSRPRSRRQRGLTLIEALITVLMLSLSALGYAALQLRGMSSNASAMWRSKATVLAYEAADRMRANPPGVEAGHYNNLINPGSPPTCTITSVCTVAQIATLDFARWRTNVASALPGGTGVICLDSSPDDGTAASPACDGSGSQLVVKVFWKERGTETRFMNVVRP